MTFSSKQKDLYEQTARPLVDSVLEGFNGTIFAYGQTGTGKTFTMEGIRSQPELRGIIPSSFAHIFDSIKKGESRQFLVRASYLEIYNVKRIDFVKGVKVKSFSRKVFVIFCRKIRINDCNYKNIPKKVFMYMISVHLLRKICKKLNMS